MPSKPKGTRYHDDYGDSYNNYTQKAKSNNYQDIYSNSNKKNQKKKKIKNTIIIVCSILFLIIGSLLIYGHSILNSVNYDDLSANNSEPSKVSSSNDTLLNDSMVLNVLLFGSDEYNPGDGGRSDSIILLSIDNRHKKLKLTSFMRDLWVKIPEHGEAKLNAAFAYGGPKLAIETIERNFNVQVDRYVCVNFESFAKIIDRLGGIDIELTEFEVETINEFLNLDEYSSFISDYKNTPILHGEGVKHLNGLQALNHARNRNSAMSDFDRTKRQREVLSAVVAKMKTATLPQILGIISDVGPMVTTNFKKTEIASLATNSLTYMNYPVEEFRLPESDNYSSVCIDGSSALAIDDMAEARLHLAQFIYSDPSETQTTTESK